MRLPQAAPPARCDSTYSCNQQQKRKEKAPLFNFFWTSAKARGIGQESFDSESVTIELAVA